MLTAEDGIVLASGFLLGILASILANVFTGPVFAALTSYHTIKLLASLRFVRDRGFDGKWIVSWDTKSSNFDPVNTSRVTVSTVGPYLAFEAQYTASGAPITYRFIGRNRGGVISGRWFDPRSDDAYHGHFQVLREGTLARAAGSWIGFSSHRGIEADKIEWKRQI